jgi:hypothetical protein
VQGADAAAEFTVSVRPPVNRSRGPATLAAPAPAYQQGSHAVLPDDRTLARRASTLRHLTTLLTVPGTVDEHSFHGT